MLQRKRQMMKRIHSLDTRDFLSSGSFKSNESVSGTSSFSSDGRRNQKIALILHIRSVGYITILTLSVVRSYLTRIEKEKGGNSLMRILNVAAFAVSGYASTEGRVCKPFNPLLGETYEANYPDKGLRFFSEKVSHHPMIVACHCEGTGWKFWGDSNLKSKFWGRSIQLDPVGVLTLEFDDGEVFQWSYNINIHLILGKLYCDHYGTMRIRRKLWTEILTRCVLSCLSRMIVQMTSSYVYIQRNFQVQDGHGKTVATIFGKWDESMYYMNGDFSGKGKGFESMKEAHMLWKRSKPPRFPTRYNLTRFAITLNELTPGLEEKLPPTDSRLRPDQRYLENGEFDMANSEKIRLEQRQRQAERCKSGVGSRGGLQKDKGSDAYRYVGGYWEARDKGDWDSCLISLARFLSISSLIKITIAFFLLSILDSFFWWKQWMTADVSSPAAP
ncbi:hypothetical protein NC651_005701 [Populus alba x Populus x berolinensis]|nr:hypothetical protein NC651_005701 [Populus alba x Populus x berolinensis]